MPRPTLPVPPDFAAYASKEGNLRLRKRFNVGGATIERWRRQLGVRYVAPVAMPKPTRPILKRKLRRWEANEAIEDLDDGFDVGWYAPRDVDGWN